MSQERDIKTVSMAEVRTRIPQRAFELISELVKRGFYSSTADFARQAILDKLIDDFELGLSELAPDILALEKKDNKKDVGNETVAKR